MMKTDIVDELRKLRGFIPATAATEIERLRTKLVKYEQALSLIEIASFSPTAVQRIIAETKADNAPR